MLRYKEASHDLDVHDSSYDVLYEIMDSLHCGKLECVFLLESCLLSFKEIKGYAFREHDIKMLLQLWMRVDNCKVCISLMHSLQIAFETNNNCFPSEISNEISNILFERLVLDFNMYERFALSIIRVFPTSLKHLLEKGLIIILESMNNSASRVFLTKILEINEISQLDPHYVDGFLTLLCENILINHKNIKKMSLKVLYKQIRDKKFIAHAIDSGIHYVLIDILGSSSKSLRKLAVLSLCPIINHSKEVLIGHDLQKVLKQSMDLLKLSDGLYFETSMLMIETIIMLEYTLFDENFIETITPIYINGVFFSKKCIFSSLLRVLDTIPFSLSYQYIIYSKLIIEVLDDISVVSKNQTKTFIRYLLSVTQFCDNCRIEHVLSYLNSQKVEGQEPTEEILINSLTNL